MFIPNSAADRKGIHMAERRMFSKKITNSARFLKMPSSAQALYFHLCMNADDDGIVEAYGIMKLIDAKEDDMKILMAKNFVKVLNSDLVTYILDWKANNKIRPDRKIDSIYKDLLLQIMPEAQLIESRERADRKAKENIGTSLGRPMDNQWTTNGPHRLGKDRLGKDRLGKVNEINKETPPQKEISQNIKNEVMMLIGGIGPIQYAQIKGMVNLYHEPDIIDAVRIARKHDKKSLAYVEGILRSWARNGKDEPPGRSQDKCRRAEPTVDEWKKVTAL